MSFCKLFTSCKRPRSCPPSHAPQTSRCAIAGTGCTSHQSCTPRRLQVLPLASMSALQRSASSKPSTAPFTIFPTRHLPTTTPNSTKDWKSEKRTCGNKWGDIFGQLSRREEEPPSELQRFPIFWPQTLAFPVFSSHMKNNKRSVRTNLSASTSRLGNVPVCTVRAPQVQETRGNRLCSCTCEESPPPHPTRLFSPFLQKEKLLPSLGFGKVGDKRLQLK